PVRIWVDVMEPARICVYLADVGARRFAARSFPAERMDAATLETVAQIVRSSLRALLDPDTPAPAASAPPRPVAPVAPSAAPPARAARLPAEPEPTFTPEARLGLLTAGTPSSSGFVQGPWLTLTFAKGGPGTQLTAWGAAGPGV